MDDAAATSAGVDARPRRTAGWLLLVAGGLFLLVGSYLPVVLGPLGLDLEMLDDEGAMLGWLGGHAGAYAGLYVLYLLQQVVLLGAVVTVRRVHGVGGPARDAATVAGLVSVVLAVLSAGLLVMAAHSGAGTWAAAGDAGERFAAVASYTTSADAGKGARLLSEVFLGCWFGWLGLAARGTGSRAWLALVPLGAVTTVVGLWKLLDPYLPWEDWLALPVSVGLAAAGLGMLRRRT